MADERTGEVGRNANVPSRSILKLCIAVCYIFEIMKLLLRQTLYSVK
jgi:hypothetical protein